jgi:hypothetical protein
MLECPSIKHGYLQISPVVKKGRTDLFYLLLIYLSIYCLFHLFMCFSFLQSVERKSVVEPITELAPIFALCLLRLQSERKCLWGEMHICTRFQYLRDESLDTSKHRPLLPG